MREQSEGLRRSERARVGMRLTIAVVSLLVIVGSGIAWSAYRNFKSSIAHGAPVPVLAAGQRDVDGHDENVLLVGNDSRAGATPAELHALSTQQDGGSVNTDTMMLLHIPANGSKATVVSFPRDLWVDIPGHGKGKINAAYGFGYSAAKDAHKSETAAQGAGLIMLIKTINQLTGLHIDHYVQINLLGFYRISNAVGGVRVCLLHAENAKTDSDEFGSGYSGINLPAGWSTIKGSQALAFVRQRHGLPRGDLDRIARQQYFLSAAFHKITSGGVLLNPFKLNRLLKAVSSSLLTDPTLDILDLARRFQEISAGNINYMTVPNDGAQMIYPDGVATSIVAVDQAGMEGFVNTLQGKPGDPAYASARAVAPSTVTVDVLNSTQIPGLARANATALQKQGFAINDVDSTDAMAKTTIEYPNGQQAKAKAVATAVPGAALALTGTVQRVTLVLGANGVQVETLMPSHSSSSGADASSGTHASSGAHASAGASKSAAPANPNCIN